MSSDNASVGAANGSGSGNSHGHGPPTTSTTFPPPSATRPSHPRTRSRLSSTSYYPKYTDDDLACKHPHLRRLSLLGSFLVALSAGSNYAFSSWAPQLQESAHLSSTSLNIVGLAGNAGVYLSGPFVGRWVDKSGPRAPLVFGAVLVAAGYASLSASYTGSWELDSTGYLALFTLLTGLGNSAAFAAAMNAQAKSWDGTKRGTATAFVLSGFGLSAFFYSTLSHSLFPGNTSDYLLLLSLGSAASYLLGYFIIKVLPPADSPMLRRHRSISSSTGAGEIISGVRAGAPSSSSHVEDPETAGANSRNNNNPYMSNRYSHRRSSTDIGARVWLPEDQTSLSGEDSDEDDEEAGLDGEQRAYGDRFRAELGSTSAERQGLLSHEGGADSTDSGGPSSGIKRVGPDGSSHHHTGSGSTPSAAATNHVASATGAVDITGRKLVRNPDFILLFLIMTAVSGSGLLLINNCGTITRTLYDYNKRRKQGGAGPADGVMVVGSWLAAAPPGTAGTRSWHKLIHASLGLFDSSAHANKIVASKPLLSALGRRESGASALASAATSSASALSSGGGVHQLVLDEHALVQQMQAHQVSAISLGNALGRILIGLLSDILVNYTSPPMRVWLLTVVCLLALTSQTLAAMPNVITTVHRLLIVSSLTGLMYGTLFGISPSLAFEWFGMKHFSQNWGIISLSPVVAGNVFNLLFGRVFDAHVPADAPSHQCPYGEECYRSVFVVTTVCCLIATVLSAVLIGRRAGWPSRHSRR